MNDLDNKADDLFEQGEYASSFDLFRQVAEDQKLDNAERAESFNMMGVIVQFDPSVNPEDETGFEYFQKALVLNPMNTSTLLNVVHTFGEAVNEHKNLTLFDFAIHQLNSINYQYTPQDLEALNCKAQIRDKVKGSE